MNRKEIIEACVFLRENNHTISDEALNFMKDVSLEKLKEIENIRHCSVCQHDGMQSFGNSVCTPCVPCGFNKDYPNFTLKTK